MTEQKPGNQTTCETTQIWRAPDKELPSHRHERVRGSARGRLALGGEEPQGGEHLDHGLDHRGEEGRQSLKR